MTNLSPLSGSPASGAGADVALPTPPVAPAFGTGPTSSGNNGTTKPPSKSKPRKRVNTAEKRHQHNAIERQRRETLNGKFIVLARLLPSLANHRRPSKSAIVNGSITHLTYQRDQRLLAAKLLRQIASEHDALLSEVNQWRKASGYAPKETNSTWEAGVEEVCNVEKEVFGTFNNVDGDEPEDEDQDESMPQLTFPTSVAPQVFTQSAGLMTPRPSADVSSAQSLLSSMLLPESRASTASSGSGLSWSQDFVWSVANNGQRAATNAALDAHAHANVFAFPSYMASESVDTSNTDSPATSQQGAVVTPPTYTDVLTNHTPSPRSSNGLSAVMEEIKPTRPTSSMWTPAQMLFAHQQAQLQRQQQQQQQQSAAFGSSFAAFAHVNNAPQAPLQSPSAESDMFTQQLMASMFSANTPASAVQPGQIDQWRKAAMGGVQRPPVHHQTSVHDLREAVRLGMGAGLNNMAWSESQNQAVEGF